MVYVCPSRTLIHAPQPVGPHPCISAPFLAYSGCPHVFRTAPTRPCQVHAAPRPCILLRPFSPTPCLSRPSCQCSESVAHSRTSLCAHHVHLSLRPSHTCPGPPFTCLALTHTLPVQPHVSPSSYLPPRLCHSTSHTPFWQRPRRHASPVLLIRWRSTSTLPRGNAKGDTWKCAVRICC